MILFLDYSMLPPIRIEMSQDQCPKTNSDFQVFRINGGLFIFHLNFNLKPKLTTLTHYLGECNIFFIHLHATSLAEQNELFIAAD